MKSNWHCSPLVPSVPLLCQTLECDERGMLTAFLDCLCLFALLCHHFNKWSELEVWHSPDYASCSIYCIIFELPLNLCFSVCLSGPPFECVGPLALPIFHEGDCFRFERQTSLTQRCVPFELWTRSILLIDLCLIPTGLKWVTCSTFHRVCICSLICVIVCLSRTAA